MRIARLAHEGSVVYASLDGERAHLFDRAPWHGGEVSRESIAWNEAALRAPIEPTKIVAIGRNYAAHAKELGNAVPTEPLIFLKPPSSIADPGGVVIRPRASERVEHEAELAVVIAKRARKVSRADAMSYVFGYTVLCDVTARDLQKKDVQFTRAKGFDTFAPTGPWIETSLDPRDLSVSLRVNGVTKQDGHTRDMIFPVDQLVEYVSHVMTLEAGDVISTGTPEGVGPIANGDLMEIEVEGIGVLRVTVEDEA